MTPSPTRFIVNADDLGASDRINEAIFEGMADGVISSATVMATGPALDAAARVTPQFANASFGVHLNLTEHRPLTSTTDLEPLLNDRGEFRRNGVYEARWSPALKRAAVREWTAQVLRIRQVGIAISHLDSHHHIHTLPALFLPLKQVQRETGIRRVRGTVSIYDRAHPPSVRLRLAKRAWWWALRNIHATRATAEFADFLMFHRAVLEGSYRPRTWPATIELMVHPDGNPAASGEEAAALRSGWMQALPAPGELVSYNAL